jgi:cytochrome P450
MLLRIGEVPTLVLSSREAAREVMKTHDASFATRQVSATMGAFTDGGRNIIFAPYGEHWRQLRKIAITELLSARRVLSFRGIREAEVAAMLRAVAAAAGERPVQMRARLCALVSDVTVRAVIGDRCKDRDLFLRQVDRINKIAAGFNPADLWPSSRIARRLSGDVRRARECRDTVFGILDGIVKERLERVGSSRGGREADLLEVLLKIQRDDGLLIPLDMDVIKYVIFDIFSAGSETSTTVLEWVMAELIRNSKAMQRATAEVRSVFSAHGTVPEHGLGELRYLHHVIRETLRLHPPAPLLLPRVAREPCRVLGYDVQPGTAVIVNAWALGRDERYWPGDPDEFRPERFDEIGDVDFRGADLQLLPFGAGRRMCPGMLFGLANVELPLANLLFHFDWEVPGVAEPTDFDMTETFGVTVRRKSGLLLRPILRIPVPGV